MHHVYGEPRAIIRSAASSITSSNSGRWGRWRRPVGRLTASAGKSRRSSRPAPAPVRGPLFDLAAEGRFRALQRGVLLDVRIRQGESAAAALGCSDIQHHGTPGIRLWSRHEPGDVPGRARGSRHPPSATTSFPEAGIALLRTVRFLGRRNRGLGESRGRTSVGDCAFGAPNRPTMCTIVPHDRRRRDATPILQTVREREGGSSRDGRAEGFCQDTSDRLGGNRSLCYFLPCLLYFYCRDCSARHSLHLLKKTT